MKLFAGMMAANTLNAMVIKAVRNISPIYSIISSNWKKKFAIDSSFLKQE
jgi:hypothetical protein